MDITRADMQSTTSPSWWGNVPASHLPSGAAWEALALAQTEALTNGMALWNEMCMRAASAKSPLDYAAAGTLMWPAYTSQAMLYCKRLYDMVTGACFNANGSTTIPHPSASVVTTGAQTKAAPVSNPPRDNNAANDARPRAKRTGRQANSVSQFRGE